MKKRVLKAQKTTMKSKLERAEEKRLLLLQIKATKAAIEEQKAHEIAFLNSLSAQNRRHEILKKHEKRFETIKQFQVERMRKQEEQKAKEQAAEVRVVQQINAHKNRITKKMTTHLLFYAQQRRKELEIQRKVKYREMLEKRKLRQKQIEQTNIEKQRHRAKTALDKEKYRELKLAFIEAQFQASRQQVRERILQKQEEWSRRHESNLDEIRKKAFEMTIARASAAMDSVLTNGGGGGGEDSTATAAMTNLADSFDLFGELKLSGAADPDAVHFDLLSTSMNQLMWRHFNNNNNNDMSDQLNASGGHYEELKAKLIEKGLEYEATSEAVKRNHQQKKQQTKVSVTKKKEARTTKLHKLLKDLPASAAVASATSASDSFGGGESTLTFDRNLNEMLRALTHKRELFHDIEVVSFCIGIFVKMCQNHLEQPSSQSTTTTTTTTSAATASALNLIDMINEAMSVDCALTLELVLSNKLVTLVEILNTNLSIYLFNKKFAHADQAKSKHGKARYGKCLLIASKLVAFFALVFANMSEEHADRRRPSSMRGRDHSDECDDDRGEEDEPVSSNKKMRKASIARTNVFFRFLFHFLYSLKN